MNKKNSFTFALVALLNLNISVAKAQSPATQQSVTPQAITLPVLGSGTVGQVAKWTARNGLIFTIGDSVITEDSVGKIGIGTTAPASKLTVGGMIQTTLGGYKFPDGTIQTTAGISSVSHGATLMGNGTSGSLLGVAENGINTAQLANGAVTAPKIAAGQVVKSLNGLLDNVSLAGGANIAITASGGNTLTVAAPAMLTAVAHDGTLTGNGTSVSPLSVAVATGAEQPFQLQEDAFYSEGENEAFTTSYIVPSDKRLVIEFASANGTVEAGQIMFLQIVTFVGGHAVGHNLVPVRVGSNVNGDLDAFASSQHMVVHADPGTAVRMRVIRSSSTGSGSFAFSLSGHLVDVP